jgi:hypothetical protein
MPKATTVYGIVSYGGHLVRGMARIVLTTEEPMTVLESDKLYYGEDVKARVTKTKALTMHELTENLEKAFASHKTDVPHMYKLNSSESVKILKTVFDVKTCKKLSFSKDSDDSEDNESTVSAKEVEPKVKSTTTTAVEPKGKSTKTEESKGKTTTTTIEEPKGKSTKTEESKGKTTTTTTEESKGKSTTTTTVEPKGKSTKKPDDEPKSNSKEVKAVKVVKEVSTNSSNKKPDLTDGKKTSTSKVSSSTVRIPLSDSDDLDSDEEL